MSDDKPRDPQPAAEPESKAPDDSFLKKREETAAGQEPMEGAFVDPEMDSPGTDLSEMELLALPGEPETLPPPPPPPPPADSAASILPPPEVLEGDEAERRRQQDEERHWQLREASLSWGDADPTASPEVAPAAAPEPPLAEPPPSEEIPEVEPEPVTEPEPPPPPPPVDLLVRAQEASRQRLEEGKEDPEEIQREFREMVQEVEDYLRQDYGLIGMLGYSSSGKTHLLHALARLLDAHGFQVEDWKKIRKVRVPGPSPARVSYTPVSRGSEDRWVLVDAGGELYARLALNDWMLADDSAGLLHSLHHCRALFLLIHLQPEHFRLDSAGSHRWMTEEERERDDRVQSAQEEIEFFDQALLFLRALQHTRGRVKELAARCATEGLEEALRSFRAEAPLLDLPVQVLFTQADTLDKAGWSVAEAEQISPRNTTRGVAPFVARHLPSLMKILLQHARRFRFDFVQSYEEKRVVDEDGLPQWVGEWTSSGAGGTELLSCGALPALEFLLRNVPAGGGLARRLRALEIDTRTALRLDRLLRRGLWRGVELPR